MPFFLVIDFSSAIGYHWVLCRTTLRPLKTPGMVKLMNPKHYHTPITANPPRKRCPVCHQTVYSLAGIHPQCAMLQADPPRPRAKKPDPVEPVAVVVEVVEAD
jgi:hypothetical protein